MQLDSPPPTSHPCAAAAASPFSPGSRPRPTTPRSTSHPVRGESSCASPRGRLTCSRGFPLEQPSAATDDRGFPLLTQNYFYHNDEYSDDVDELLLPDTMAPSPNRKRFVRGDGDSNNAGGDRGSTSCSGAAAGAATDRGRRQYQSQRHFSSQQQSPPPPPSATELSPRKNLNLFLSPFSSTLPPERATVVDTTTPFDGNRTSWVGRVVTPGGGGVGSRERRGQRSERREGGMRGGGGGGGGERELFRQESPPPPLSPGRQTKRSHAKLDLLLGEMQRLNGRLDTIVGRLGALEERSGRR